MRIETTKKYQNTQQENIYKTKPIKLNMDLQQEQETMQYVQSFSKSSCDDIKMDSEEVGDEDNFHDFEVAFVKLSHREFMLCFYFR